jgi:hypothetical protein
MQREDRDDLGDELARGERERRYGGGKTQTWKAD